MLTPVTDSKTRILHLVRHPDKRKQKNIKRSGVTLHGGSVPPLSKHAHHQVTLEQQTVSLWPQPYRNHMDKQCEEHDGKLYLAGLDQ